MVARGSTMLHIAERAKLAGRIPLLANALASATRIATKGVGRKNTGTTWVGHPAFRESEWLSFPALRRPLKFRPPLACRRGIEPVTLRLGQRAYLGFTHPPHVFSKIRAWRETYSVAAVPLDCKDRETAPPQARQIHYARRFLLSSAFHPHQIGEKETNPAELGWG